MAGIGSLVSTGAIVRAAQVGTSANALIWPPLPHEIRIETDRNHGGDGRRRAPRHPERLDAGCSNRCRQAGEEPEGLSAVHVPSGRVAPLLFIATLVETRRRLIPWSRCGRVSGEEAKGDAGCQSLSAAARQTSQCQGNRGLEAG